MFAGREGCAACVAPLAAAKAELNATDLDNKLTPLIMALINGHYDAAAALINAGADVNMADNLGRTPLYAAVEDHSMPVSARPSPKEVDEETPTDSNRAGLKHYSDDYQETPIVPSGSSLRPTGSACFF